MYRIRRETGEEVNFGSIDELGAAVASGVVTAKAEIFHARAEKWLPIASHPHFKMAHDRINSATAPKATSSQRPALSASGQRPAITVPQANAPAPAPSASAPRDTSTPTARDATRRTVSDGARHHRNGGNAEAGAEVEQCTAPRRTRGGTEAVGTFSATGE